MDTSTALAALSALGNRTRLDLFRLLVRAGSKGLLAGDLSTALDLKQSTTSVNLSILLDVGLVRNRRVGRTVRYFAQLETMHALTDYLSLECGPARFGPVAPHVPVQAQSRYA